MTIDEQIAILQALKEGKKIEARTAPTLEWRPWNANDPCNFYSFDYRIVPEPRRWIIYTFELVSGTKRFFAQPYATEIPQGATILCTATEDINLGEAAAPYLEALKEKINRHDNPVQVSYIQ